MQIIALVVVVVIVCLIIFIATRPEDFRITRTTLISEKPDLVFKHINSFHNWNDWSPWAKLDPNSEKSYMGSESGVGAQFKWSGNKDVGEGMMTIIESTPYEHILIKLDFLKPFKATNTAEFKFETDGHQTSLTWSMSGKNNFMAKAANLFINCDKMVGTLFEQGLSNIKSIVEETSK